MRPYARYTLATEPGTETGERIPVLDETLTINQIWNTLRAELEQLDDAYEYFSVAHDSEHKRGAPIGRTRWIACYAVTGGSEGHYIHVDRIYQAEEYARTWTHQGLFLGKTFGGYERACEIAAYLGARLGA